MRYAIFSDVHGNLEALQAVIETARDFGARSFFCGGDIVGYGANPHQCIQEVDRIKAITVAGNHDWAVTGKEDTAHFNPFAREAVEWTKEHLAPADIKELNSFELVCYHDNFLIVHGSLNNPEQFMYLNDITLANDTFYLMDRPLCFIGHTHIPLVMTQQGSNVAYEDKQTIELKDGVKYIVNVGSVGQPRDGNPKASFCIYDPDLNRIEIKRVEYNIKKAQQKILQAGLPEILAQRLSVGQ